MSEDDLAARRVRFYGVNDMATVWQVPRVAELADQFDPKKVPTRTEDILELHNVQQYLEYGFLPNAYNQEQRDQAKAQIPQMRSAVARYGDRQYKLPSRSGWCRPRLSRGPSGPAGSARSLRTLQ